MKFYCHHTWKKRTLRKTYFLYALASIYVCKSLCLKTAPNQTEQHRELKFAEKNIKKTRFIYVDDVSKFQMKNYYFSWHYNCSYTICSESLSLIQLFSFILNFKWTFCMRLCMCLCGGFWFLMVYPTRKSYWFSNLMWDSLLWLNQFFVSMFNQLVFKLMLYIVNKERKRDEDVDVDVEIFVS